MTASRYAKFILISALIPILISCQENYRYPCQDPDNWELKECKKPYCSANGTCPEDLLHYTAGDKNAVPAVPAQPASVETAPKGDCK